MGVGAVFVSTLALHKWPSPEYPPDTQQDRLALMLQLIVTFVVLGSIVIRTFFWNNLANDHPGYQKSSTKGQSTSYQQTFPK